MHHTPPCTAIVAPISSRRYGGCKSNLCIPMPRVYTVPCVDICLFIALEMLRTPCYYARLHCTIRTPCTAIVATNKQSLLWRLRVQPVFPNLAGALSHQARNPTRQSALYVDRRSDYWHRFVCSCKSCSSGRIYVSPGPSAVYITAPVGRTAASHARLVASMCPGPSAHSVHHCSCWAHSLSAQYSRQQHLQLPTWPSSNAGSCHSWLCPRRSVSIAPSRRSDRLGPASYPAASCDTTGRSSTCSITQGTRACSVWPHVCPLCGRPYALTTMYTRQRAPVVRSKLLRRSAGTRPLAPRNSFNQALCFVECRPTSSPNVPNAPNCIMCALVETDLADKNRFSTVWLANLEMG